MCDAVAVMPVAVILALTVRSGLMVTVPVPVADVMTAGTSLLPERATCWPYIIWDIGPIEEQLARIPTTPATARAVTNLDFRNIVFTYSSVERVCFRCRRVI